MSLADWLRAQPDRCEGCGYHEMQGCHCPSAEWDIFTRALRQAADPDGLIHQGKVRPLIQSIPAKHRGQLYRRARSEGLIVDTGEREPSDDTRGRNTDKLQRLYRLGTDDTRQRGLRHGITEHVC